MKYALVLENCTKTCNDTSAILASLGYLITPVFSPKKALHAAHMIQFDLIVTCTTSLPGDRRSLVGELSRCSPEAVIVLLVDSERDHNNGNADGVSAILPKPFAAEHIAAIVERRPGHAGIPLPARCAEHERRRRAID